MPKRRMTRPTLEQVAERWDALDGESIVPNREEELIRQVGQAIYDGCRGDEQRRPAYQPAGHVVVPFGQPVSEMVALIDDHQIPRGCREIPKTRMLVRA
jgi:hypothetical protein